MDYVMTNEYVNENTVVCAFHPILTDEEREKRRKNLEDAAVKFWIECEIEAEEKEKADIKQEG